MLGKGHRRRFTFAHKGESGDVDVTVEIEVLTTQEVCEAELRAAQYVNQLDDKSELGAEERKALVRNSRMIEILATALRDPDDHSPWATSASEIRAQLTDYETGVLWAAYELWQDEQSPLETSTDPAKFELIARAIDKEQSLVPLALSAPSTRRAFVLFMARSFVGSPTARSSPT
jgi:hypothetical protein